MSSGHLCVSSSSPSFIIIITWSDVTSAQRVNAYTHGWMKEDIGERLCMVAECASADGDRRVSSAHEQTDHRLSPIPSNVTRRMSGGTSHSAHGARVTCSFHDLARTSKKAGGAACQESEQTANESQLFESLVIHMHLSSMRESTANELSVTSRVRTTKSWSLVSLSCAKQHRSRARALGSKRSESASSQNRFSGTLPHSR